MTTKSRTWDILVHANQVSETDEAKDDYAVLPRDYMFL